MREYEKERHSESVRHVFVTYSMTLLLAGVFVCLRPRAGRDCVNMFSLVADSREMCTQETIVTTGLGLLHILGS